MPVACLVAPTLAPAQFESHEGVLIPLYQCGHHVPLMHHYAFTHILILLCASPSGLCLGISHTPIRDCTCVLDIVTSLGPSCRSVCHTYMLAHSHVNTHLLTCLHERVEMEHHQVLHGKRSGFKHTLSLFPGLEPQVHLIHGKSFYCFFLPVFFLKSSAAKVNSLN